MSRFDSVMKKPLALGRDYLLTKQTQDSCCIEHVLSDFFLHQARDAVPAQVTAKWAAELLIDYPELLTVHEAAMPECGPGVMGSLKSAAVCLAYRQTAPALQDYALELGYLDGDTFDGREEESRSRDAVFRR